MDGHTDRERERERETGNKVILELLFEEQNLLPYYLKLAKTVTLRSPLKECDRAINHVYIFS